MAGEYDDTLKRLVNDNKQDFARWVMQGKQIEIIANSRRATEFKRTVIADAIIDIKVNGKLALLHFEFQVDNEEDVPTQMLDYQMQARREYQLPVSSTVIYLKKHKQVPQSPLKWPFPEEEDMLSFRYKVIELADMSTDELRATGLPGLLPLLVLTKGGTTHDIIEEIIVGLEAAQRRKSLQTAKLLASLAFKHKGEQERNWIRRRFDQMRDLLYDTDAYQEILEEGRAEERQRMEAEQQKERQRMEQERQRMEAEQQKEQQRKLEEERQLLRDQLETLVDVVQMRFPEIAPLAKKQGGTVSDPKRLQRLINKMLKVPTLEKAVQDLLEHS